jgi:hypothetical protein
MLLYFCKDLKSINSKALILEDSKDIIEGNGGVLENIIDGKFRHWIRNYA